MHSCSADCTEGQHAAAPMLRHGMPAFPESSLIDNPSVHPHVHGMGENATALPQWRSGLHRFMEVAATGADLAHLFGLNAQRGLERCLIAS